MKSVLECILLSVWEIARRREGDEGNEMKENKGNVCLSVLGERGGGTVYGCLVSVLLSCEKALVSLFVAEMNLNTAVRLSSEDMRVLVARMCLVLNARPLKRALSPERRRSYA